MRGAKSDPESKGNALSCGDAGGLDRTVGKGDSEQKRSEEGGVKKGLSLGPAYRACSLVNRHRRAEGDLNRAFRHNLHLKLCSMHC